MTLRRGVLLACLALAVLVAAGARPEEPATAQAPVGGAGWDIARQNCDKANDTLQVLMLVDESISLQQTDPGGFRETRISGWLTDLVSIASNGTDVRLAILGYGSTVNEHLGWVDFGADQIEAAYDAVGRLTKSEYDTDHALALMAASGEFAAEAARSGAGSCPVLLWFTDGIYDFQNFSTDERQERGLPTSPPYTDLDLSSETEDEVVEDGITAACGPSGPVRTMRGHNTAILAVALDPEGVVDFRLVEEMTTGRGYADGEYPPCDLRPYQVGVFDDTDGGTTTTSTTPTTDPPAASTTTADAPLCPSAGCTGSVQVAVPELATQTEITVSPGLTGSASGGVDAIRITDPNGSAIEIAGGRGTEAAGDVTMVAAPLPTGQVVVQLLDAGGLAPGSWDLVLTADDELDPSASATHYGQYEVRVVEPDAIRTGSDSVVALEVLDPAGDPVASDVGERLVLRRVEGDANLELERSADSTFGLEVTSAELDRVEGDDLEARVEIDAGPDVETQAAAVRVPVLRPEFPSIILDGERAGTLTTERLETAGALEIAGTATGPQVGSGCIDLSADPSFGDDSITVTYSANRPLCLDAEEEVSVEIVVQFTERVHGTSCAAFDFELSSTQLEETRASSTLVCVPTDKSPTWWTRLAAWLATALMFLSPFLLLALLNRRATRFAPPIWWGHASLSGSISRDGTLAYRRNGTIIGFDTVGAHHPDVVNPAAFGMAPARLRGTEEGLVDLEHRAVTAYRRTRALPSVASLFRGPTLYQRPVPGEFAVVGTRDQIHHVGPLRAPIRVPAMLDGYFVLAVDGGGYRIEVLKLTSAETITETIDRDIRLALERDAVTDALRADAVGASGAPVDTSHRRKLGF